MQNIISSVCRLLNKNLLPYISRNSYQIAKMSALPSTCLSTRSRRRSRSLITISSSPPDSYGPTHSSNSNQAQTMEVDDDDRITFSDTTAINSTSSLNQGLISRRTCSISSLHKNFPSSIWTRRNVVSLFTCCLLLVINSQVNLVK